MGAVGRRGGVTSWGGWYGGGRGVVNSGILIMFHLLLGEKPSVSLKRLLPVSFNLISPVVYCYEPKYKGKPHHF